MELEKKLPLTEVLGVPQKGIIFTDLDGVWLDEENNFSSPAQVDTNILEEAKNAGFWVVLNSDTASESLYDVSRNLGCAPAVIGEGGAVVYAPDQGLKEYLSSWKPFFDKFKKDMVQQLITEDARAAIYTGDATSFLKSGDESLLFSSGTAYLVNTVRDCSTGVFTRTVDSQGTLGIDYAKTQYTEKILNELLRKSGINGELVCTRYPNLGSNLIKDPAQTKWKAVKWFIDQFPKNLSYYMIGDSIADSMDSISDRVTTCAVGNASDELKKDTSLTGGIIAPDNLTIAGGANYIIKNILEGGNR